jgi:hypothetical protein
MKIELKGRYGRKDIQPVGLFQDITLQNSDP